MKTEKEINYEISLAASEYANRIIMRGSTQLSNNDLKPEEFEKLVSAVKAARENSEKDPYGILPKDLAGFATTIEKAYDYRLGNCSELTNLALCYCLQQDVTAEIFSIVPKELGRGGDHVFLAVGRNKDSDPRRPLTWGENCFICDPLHQKVYPAAEYYEELKAFEQSYDEVAERNINRAFPFDHYYYEIQLNKTYTTDNMKNLIKDMLSNVNGILDKLIKIMDDHKENLQQQINKLSMKMFGSINTIILEKIKNIEATIEYLGKRKYDFDTKVSFPELYTSVNKTLKESITKVINSLEFQNQNLATNIKNRFDRETVESLNTLIEKSNEGMKNIFKPGT